MDYSASRYPKRLGLSTGFTVKNHGECLQSRYRLIASTTSWVVLSPPRSGVRYWPSAITLFTAVSNRSANEGNWRCLNIIADESRRATGLAFFSFNISSLPTFPAEAPCSNTALSAPTLPPGITPVPPAIPAAVFATRFPYRLGVTITSNCSGLDTSCMQQLSTIISLYLIPEYLLATFRQDSKKRPSASFIMLALCTAVTVFLLLRYAYSNAYFAMRSEQNFVITLSLLLRNLPLCNGGKGCRPVVRVYGQDPLAKTNSARLVFSSFMADEPALNYSKEECEFVKLELRCQIQGDVFLECIHLHDDQVSEEMIFKIMLHTGFVRSNILELNCDDMDVPWNTKVARNFKAEVLFRNMNEVPVNITLELGAGEEYNDSDNEFFEVEEIFTPMPESEDRKVIDSAIVPETNLVDNIHRDCTLHNGTPRWDLDAEEIDIISSEQKVLNDVSLEQKVLDIVSSEQKVLDDVSSEQKVLHDIPSEQKALDDISSEQKALDDISSSSEQKTLDDISSEQKTLDDFSSEKKTLDDIPSEHRALADISSEQKALNISSEQKTLDDIPSEHKALGDISSAQKTLYDIPSEQKALCDISSEQKTLDDIPSEQKDLDDISSEQKALDAGNHKQASEAESDITSTSSKNIVVVDLCGSKIQDVKVEIEPKPVITSPGRPKQNKKNKWQEITAKTIKQHRVISQWVPRAKTPQAPEVNKSKAPVYKWIPKGPATPTEAAGGE